MTDNHTQLHAGLHAGRWHLDAQDGTGSTKYRTGNLSTMTPEKLLEESFLTIQQLLENHPELNEKTITNQIRSKMNLYYVTLMNNYKPIGDIINVYVVAKDMEDAKTNVLAINSDWRNYIVKQVNLVASQESFRAEFLLVLENKVVNNQMNQKIKGLEDIISRT